MKNVLKYGTMVMAIVFVLVSCDNDVTELGSEFLGIDIDGAIIEEDFEVVAFSAPLNAVQTNNFPLVQLGVYQDPVYGESTYDFVSQLSLSTTGVDFSEDPEFKSVTLSIPYFSTKTGMEGESSTYQLDSVYGGGSIDFEIYRSNYFLNSFDIENVDQAAAYYSSLGDVIDSNKGNAIEILNNNGGIAGTTISNFTPSADEIEITEIVDGESTVVERLSPRLQLKLDPEFWKELLVSEDGSINFTSDSEFQNAFRGLYFKVTGSSDGGVFSNLNLGAATISIDYVSRFVDAGDADGDGDFEEVINVDSSYDINFAGNRVVLIDTDVPSDIASSIQNSYDPEMGASRLYVKGGPGAITFIDLFGNLDDNDDGEADALTELKEKSVLINEANLEFYVDRSVVTQGNGEPDRIAIYDFVENRYLLDFQVDNNGPTENLNHLGPLVSNDDGSASYTIRLTNHIAQIVQGNIDNNRLALIVSQNIRLTGFSDVKDQNDPLPINSVLRTSAISHRGTVLHGNLSNDQNKRLKLKVYYSEVN